MAVAQPSTARNELVSNLLKGRARHVMITGTGVSLQSLDPKLPGSSVASWPGLLKHGVDYCKSRQLVSNGETEIVHSLIHNGKTDDLIDAAQRIHGWLDKQTSGRLLWIQDTIGRLRVHDPSLISAIQNLGVLIATLNYDNLICDVTKRPPLHWQQQNEIDEHIRNESIDYILHIHGHWRHPPSMVLDRTSYEEIRRDDRMQLLMCTFARFYHIVFIGCGSTLHDPNFDLLIQWCRKTLNGSNQRHFILCRNSDECGFRRDLSAYGFLEPLPYGDDYTDLVPFLQDLAKDSGARASTINPPVSAASPGSAAGASNIQKASDIWRLQIQ